MVHLYSTDPNSPSSREEALLKIDTQIPITDVTWDGFTGKKAFLSNVQGEVKEIDLENGRATNVIGTRHDSGIQALTYIPNSKGILVSGSWDKSIQYLDCRSSNNGSNGSQTAFLTKLPEKVLALDATENNVVVAMTNRLVHIYDIRNPTSPSQIRESSLKYQTRSIKCMPNGKGYAQSSIEGRVAIEYFDPSPKIQAEKYAFKCHRLPCSDVDLVSSVNSLSFHKKFGTMFTAGSDCYVCLWDQKSKKRLRQYPKFDQSVVCLDTDYKDGNSILAIATSDDSFKTSPSIESQIPKPGKSSIFLKYLGDNEGQPKQKQ
ncbi:putative WD repeat-containing protein [Wickerhamomyces ciferrii]|uniref:WD repeat-containing protein n=1 Tax=Wickerhamomyces ciferrii (strain ATCC 14091 / BCRC 22168 / CBS 111 / JCM 3599 / NBRC 0793 / NRRL Y-1031 F-60-10) TaxID=1206466 RepID=K0KHE1_WICCF|nr:putative WD repeat-containing protein [Wickerhamomyces ciferrii]CCH44635.1 putative WD repeat-containing protein [Wickerhamomyces ciferrii]